ncbi:glycosyltransferase family 39 protein [Sphaerobacter thermophilus]|uniref:glycosyltransferase family 39 protein n=1 Tax=Sphaerobacter thermophilus TaxID=2057 RepID=UPI0039C4C38C
MTVTESARAGSERAGRLIYARLAHYGVLAAIVVAGAALRLTALNRQSLWFDEIDVVVRAQRPLDQVLRTFVAAGENGPLYNILLALWVRLAGISEIAVRAPSAIAGVVGVLLIYLLGRRVAGATVGLIGAGLLAISPYHVWYSQEAKMYAMVVVLALASTYALVEALERNERRWWVAYAVSTTLLFYTHVATVLVFAAQSLYAFYTVILRRAWPGRARGWLLAVAVLTLPYVPIALWALRVIGGQVATWHAQVGLWDALQIFAVKFAVNRYDLVVQERAAVLYAVLAGLGAVVLALRRQPARWWLLLLSLSVVPVVGLWLVSLRQSVFSDRYAIVALPAYLLLVAATVAWLIRQRWIWPLGLAAAFVLVTFAWGPLRDVNRAHTAQKEDWRSAYAWVADHAQPGDVLVVTPGYLITTYDYFAQREPRLAQYQAIAMRSFTADVWFNEEEMVRLLQERAGSATGFWLIESPDRVGADDPERALERWFDTHGDPTEELVVNGVRVTRYELSAPPAEIDTA